jgi:hypothetical protein
MHEFTRIDGTNKEVEYMKCRKLKRELSAYLDNELPNKEKQLIYEHLQKCEICQNELTSLLQQDKFLKQLQSIEPSIDFDIKMWEKIRLQNANNEPRIIKLSWLPIPAMSFLIILIVLNLSIFSFTLFAKGQEIRNRITYKIIKNLVIPSNLLTPISLLKFCQDCCEILCRCAQNQGVSSKCICGKHEYQGDM